MANRTGSARDAALWVADDTVRLQHVRLTEGDLEWLRPVRRLTVWSVKVPRGFFARLPDLEWLDVRGGSGESADFVEGCTSLRYLSINQVRGLSDLTAITELAQLELLSLYGLPQLRTLPSLRGLTCLRRIEVGSMKGLESLAPLLDAAALEELLLVRVVSLEPSDPERIARHPTLSWFDWIGEDVPVRTWKPVVDRVGKPRTDLVTPEQWFSRRP